MSETLLVNTETYYKPYEIDVREVPLAAINTAAQYRRKNNPSQQSLNKSIAQRGLINPLTTALLEPDIVEEYLRFTNTAWDTDYTSESYTPYYDLDDSGQDNDKYLLLLAGHSRLKALNQDAIDKMYDPQHYLVPISVRHDAYTVRDLLQIQIEENIHSNPDPQYLAKILAESYLYELEKGSKISKRNFAKEHNASEKAVTDAINYASLPKDYHIKTDEGLLPFRVAAEMGRGLHILAKYAVFKGMDPRSSEEYVANRLQSLEMKYTTYGRVINAVQAIRSELEGYLAEMAASDTNNQGQFDLTMEEVSETTWAEKILRRELHKSRVRHLGDTAQLHNATTRFLKAKGLGVSDEEIAREIAAADQALALID